VQELIEQKDRIEKLIANILNGEGYSKLNQIVKENVKAVLSDNKMLISVSFTALIQTLKADPQMVKSVQNIPSANDGEQHKDNNITKYFESIKDTLLDLAEKNYENLVEALTNNVVDTTADTSFSFNLTSSLPSSSSTFVSPYKSGTYRIEEPEHFHENSQFQNIYSGHYVSYQICFANQRLQVVEFLLYLKVIY
jgi:hypothetical protein